MTKPGKLNVVFRLEESSQACHATNSPYALEQFSYTCVLACVGSHICKHTHTKYNKIKSSHLKIIYSEK